jgi:hypothetical protein
MKFSIKNFAEGSPVEVEFTNTKEFGKLIQVSQLAGAMHFLHSMRPDQARFMAAALQMAADEADGIVDEVTA